MYERLKKICKERGTTVTELCKQATGNSANLATWKKGYMRSDYLSNSADILKVSTDYILGRTDEPHINTQNNNSDSAVTGATYTAGDNNTISINTTSGFDKTTLEFIGLFDSLPIEDKIEVMALVKRLKKN